MSAATAAPTNYSTGPFNKTKNYASQEILHADTFHEAPFLIWISLDSTITQGEDIGGPLASTLRLSGYPPANRCAYSS